MKIVYAIYMQHVCAYEVDSEYMNWNEMRRRQASAGGA